MLFVGEHVFTWFCSVLVLNWQEEGRSYNFALSGLKLLSLSNLPTSPSHVARITGVRNCAPLHVRFLIYR